MSVKPQRILSIATLAFSMSAEICAQACLDNNSAEVIRALASDEG